MHFFSSVLEDAVARAEIPLGPTRNVEVLLVGAVVMEGALQIEVVLWWTLFQARLGDVLLRGVALCARRAIAAILIAATTRAVT